jgi:hypothetical protein
MLLLHIREMGHSYIDTAINQSSNLLKSDLLACIAEIYSPIIVAHLDALEEILLSSR